MSGDCCGRRAPTPAQAGCSSTGIPLSTDVPDSGSIARSSANTFEFTPACSAATRIWAPGRSWPQPCGRLTTPGRIASVTSTGATTSPDPRGDPRGAAVGQSERVGIVGVHLQRAARLPFTSTLMLCIHELLLRRCRRPTRTKARRVQLRDRRREPLEVVDEHVGGELDRPLGVRRISGIRGTSAPKSRPCGCSSRSSSDVPSGSAPNPSPNGPGAQHEVDHPLGAAPPGRVERAHGARRGRVRTRSRTRPSPHSRSSRRSPCRR